MTILMNATEQHSPVVLFMMLYQVVLTFYGSSEILKCDHSNGSYCTVLSYQGHQTASFGKYLSVGGG